MGKGACSIPWGLNKKERDIKRRKLRAEAGDCLSLGEAREMRGLGKGIWSSRPERECPGRSLGAEERLVGRNC